ncbi:hypothetical protein ACA910_018996 [Epithemia clementina (nom. ined.)]
MTFSTPISKSVFLGLSVILVLHVMMGFHFLKYPKIDSNTVTIRATTTDTSKNELPSHFRVLSSDPEYSGIGGNYVVEEYKLLFFTTAKVSCTTWKLLFRKMMGFDDDSSSTVVKAMIHSPKHNQLKRLGNYSLDQATHIMTSPEWTRAIFVRDPMERFVSAYLDKGVGTSFMEAVCCKNATTASTTPKVKRSSSPPISCGAQIKQSPQAALSIIRQGCPDNPHWRPQSKRISQKYLQHVNFIGRLETVQQDSETLLRRIGAWEKFGRTGWGVNRTDRIFLPLALGHNSDNVLKEAEQERQGQDSLSDTSSNVRKSYQNVADFKDGQHHATHASEKMEQYITTQELFDELMDFYRDDYDNPMFKFTIPQFSFRSTSGKQ